MMAHPHFCAPHHWCAPVRYCRREAKELLVRPESGAAQISPQHAVEILSDDQAKTTGANIVVNASREKPITGSGDAIIGGGCCVHLSIEYMQLLPDVEGATPDVRVRVTDSSGAAMEWRKRFQTGYHVQEDIITTHPGALLEVRVADAIARVRWCEVFSC